MKRLHTCLMVMTLMLSSVSLWAQEVVMDSLPSAIDSLEAYRHPLPIQLDLHTPHRAIQAASCPVDSVIGTDMNGDVLTQKYYYYDAAGNTVAEINYKWSGGVCTGVSNYKKIFTGSTATTTVNYQWDATNHHWIGKDSTQLLFYSTGKQSAQETYKWENGAWRADTKYEYEYDANGKQTLSCYSTWNATAKTLVYSNKWVWQYNNRLTDEAYWIYSNNQWIGSSRNVKELDAAGNKILDEQYSGWVNNDWKGRSKYTAQFNSNKKEIEYITYNWSSSIWVENYKTTKEYEGDNVTDNAIYTWSNGWVGSSRTSKTYSGTLVTSEIAWAWDTNNGAWVYNTQQATVYTGTKISTQTNSKWNGSVWVNVSQLINTYQSSRLTEANTKAWRNGVWQDSLRTTHGFDGQGIDTLAISCAWNGTAWIPLDSTTRVITYVTVAGKSLVQEDVSMKWTASTKKWTGENRKTSLYDEWGNEKQSDTYTYVVGTGWVNNVRRLYAYKDGNKNLQTLNAYMTWNNTKKVWKGTTKTENAYDDSNRKYKTSSYKWNADRNNKQGDWEGLSSTEDIYENNIKVTSYSYKWDATIWNWIGMFRHDYTYAGSKIQEQIDWRYSTTTGWYRDTRVVNNYDTSGRTIYTENFQWIADENRWCSTSLTQTNYDDAALGGRLRSELKTIGSACVTTSYALSHYFYACDPHEHYTIRFVNYDGTELSSENFSIGETPSYNGATPTKPADAQYTYTFAGWDQELIAVTGNATYTATYSTTTKSYTITWLNSDNTPIDQMIVEYGVVPTHEDATRANTAEYTYTFAGWDVTPVAVTGDATYTATFTASKRSYTVTFKNGDEVLQSGAVEYGLMPTYTGATPIKNADAQYTYTFNGWDSELSAVTEDRVYTAIYGCSVNSYTINWLNDDHTQIDQTTVLYGVVPTHADATKPETDEYTYTFSGWDVTPVAVTGEATYTATFSATKRSYTITFRNGDEVLQSSSVEYGLVPIYTGATPSQPADAQYSYSFVGWDVAPVAVTGEATYTAVFDSVVNTYTVIFYFEDGVTEIDRMILPYGATPSTNYIPGRNAEEHCYYSFAGWYPEIAPVTGDASYTPTYTVHYNEYTIIFRNYDRSELQRSNVPYGTMPSYDGAEPVRPRTAQYTYTFAGWTPELTVVDGNATYTATYESTVNSYTIIFLDEDGTELDRAEVPYGQVPSTAVVPTKEPDEEYTYTFAGWSPRLTKVTSDATYTATYRATPKTDGLLDNTRGNYEAIKVLINGMIYIRRGDKTYTPTGVLVE